MSKHVNQEANRRKKRWMIAILIILLLLLISSCSVAVWSMFFRDTTPTLTPDYAPQEIEPNLNPTPDTGKDKLEQSSSGGSVSLEFIKDVTVDLSDKTVEFAFTNPQESNQDMVLQVIVQGRVIAQSQLIPPGNELKKLTLRDDVTLSAGGYDGKYTVLYYYENGEKAMVQTDIPLTIKVQE